MSDLKRRALKSAPREISQEEIEETERRQKEDNKRKVLEKAKEIFGVDWYLISCNKHTYSYDGPPASTSYCGRIRHEDIVLNFSCGKFGERPTFSFEARCGYRFYLGLGPQCWYEVKGRYIHSLEELGKAIADVEKVHQHHYFKPAAGVREGPMSEGRYEITENGDMIIY